jgi:BNR repeat-like domain
MNPKRKKPIILLLALFLVLFYPMGPVEKWTNSTGVARAQFPGLFGAQRAPSIDIDKSNNLYLMMSVATSPAVTPHSQIFFTISKTSGASWDNLPLTRNLSNSPGEAFGPSLAVSKTKPPRVYVTYQDTSTGVTQAYLIHSKKKTKFKPPQNITPHDGGAFFPRVALDSNEALNVVWGDTSQGLRQVAFTRSTDRGSSFSDPIEIGRSAGEAFFPEITVGPDEAINVVWQDNGPGHETIMFSRSTDGGISFSEPAAISTGIGDAVEPHIASDKFGFLHVVWADHSASDSQAFYSRSTDSGLTFSEPINVTNDPGADVRRPVVTTFQSNVYFAYNDESNHSKQVFVAMSDDEGLSFKKPVQVSLADKSIGHAHSAAMVVDKTGKLHIVWIDSSIVGNDEGILFYSNSTDGRTFSAERMILAVL